ncbi:MAG: 4Fe-4S binding protein [Negativicutes bacterium]|nr:4Fe-4S binding protein [Negativicutes bacterium]
MQITLNKRNCKGCNICVTFCPEKILSLDGLGKIQVMDEGACIGCGQCELRCPDFAIRVYKEGAK